MNEESVFYMLMAICEILMPQYYNKVMLGCMVHQTLFENLIEERLPQLHSHFKKLSVLFPFFLFLHLHMHIKSFLIDWGLVKVPITPITMPWFLLLFIGTLPLAVNL
jgi:hypothetical protein